MHIKAKIYVIYFEVSMSKQKDVMTYSPQRLYCMDELDVGAVSIDQV